jgi:nucleoside 2-deoxyribosyltransferase
LRALRESDIIWLHAPDGYVGVSAAYELGFAAAIGKPVFSFNTPTDEMLATQVYRVQSVFSALHR